MKITKRERKKINGMNHVTAQNYHSFVGQRHRDDMAQYGRIAQRTTPYVNPNNFN